VFLHNFVTQNKTVTRFDFINIFIFSKTSVFIQSECLLQYLSQLESHTSASAMYVLTLMLKQNDSMGCLRHSIWIDETETLNEH
jgi:hypothetical protein